MADSLPPAYGAPVSLMHTPLSRTPPSLSLAPRLSRTPPLSHPLSLASRSPSQANFLGWDDSKKKSFVDPYEAKLAAIKAANPAPEPIKPKLTPRSSSLSQGKLPPPSPAKAASWVKEPEPEPVEVADPAPVVPKLPIKPADGSYTLNYEELKKPADQLPNGLDLTKKEQVHPPFRPAACFSPHLTLLPSPSSPHPLHLTPHCGAPSPKFAACSTSPTPSSCRYSARRARRLPRSSRGSRPRSSGRRASSKAKEREGGAF